MKHVRHAEVHQCGLDISIMSTALLNAIVVDHAVKLSANIV